jgi:hypothetical protein
MNRPKISSFSTKVTLVLGGLFITVNAFAETITVTDCNGVPRALEQIDAGEVATVKLTAQSAWESNTLVYLTETTSGQKMSGKLNANTAMFEKMEPGTYTICGNTPAAMKSQVTISTTTTTAKGGSNVAPLALGAAAIAGGAVAIANSDGSDGDDNTPETSGANVPPTSSSNNGGHSNNPSNPCTECQKRPGAAAQDCLNGDEPNPVSPFL